MNIDDRDTFLLYRRLKRQNLHYEFSGAILVLFIGN